MLHYLAFICISITTIPLASQNDSKLDELSRDILSRDIEIRLSVRDRILRTRLDNKKTCSKMMQIISSDNSSEKYCTPKQLALFTMAHHVDYNADSQIIKTFVDNIDVRFDGNPFETVIQPPDKSFPAVRGLLMIGERATIPILEKIKGTDDRKTHNLLAYWLYKYYGKRMALQFFNDLLKEENVMPIEVRKRLIYVFDKIEKQR